MLQVDVEETSASEEIARIQRAIKRTKKWTSTAEGSDLDSGRSIGVADMETTSMPKSSGVFDYAQWLVEKLTSEQCGKLQRPSTYMDVCAGLGTSVIAQEALRRAMLQYRLCIDGQCTCLIEIAKDLQAALRRHLECVKATAPILESNADLTSGNILDVDGNPVDQKLE